MKVWISLLMVALFLSFCVYTYKVRTNFNVDKQNTRIRELHYHLEVIRYGYSLLPQKDKNEVFFNSIEKKYPSFKENEYLCELMGYKKSKKEVEQDKVKEKVEKVDVDTDTTAVQVMDNIINVFN